MGVMLGLLNELYGQEGIERWLYESLDAGEFGAKIDDLLRILGEKIDCERTYVFEYTENDTISNSYEWCCEGVKPQKEFLQREPKKLIDWWLELFEDDAPVVILDVEEYRETHPLMYSVLKAQDIHSLVSVPLRDGGEDIGFIGADNPDISKLDNIVELLTTIGRVVSRFIRLEHMSKEVEFVRYHDPLTRAFNRCSFNRLLEKGGRHSRFGAISCRVKNLKQMNNSSGYDQGDEAIKRCYELLLYIFYGHQIYRTNGNEFIVCCFGIGQGDFLKRVHELQESAEESDSKLNIGAHWSNEELPLEAMIRLAEENMVSTREDRELLQRREDGERNHEINSALSDQKTGRLDQFLRENYFNMEIFLNSLALSNYHPFFGDLQTDKFYIADPMKEMFGFEENIISHLVLKWEELIERKEDLELYRQDLGDVMRFKKDTHDIRYRIKDKLGNEFWIRCCGALEWDKDRKKPLFMAGGISKLGYDFIVDPTTNFQREYEASIKIREQQARLGRVNFIGFKLNNFKEINNLSGRLIANNLLKDLSQNLLKHFDGVLQFFRLDGLKFLGVPTSQFAGDLRELIPLIRREVEQTYADYNISLKRPCSFCLFDEARSETSIGLVIADALNLLDFAKSNPDKEYVEHSPENIQLHSDRNRMIMALNRDALHGFENFRIVIQPIVSVDGFKIIGGEVLLRWRFKDKDISPMVFIPLLEKNRQILSVGKWVVEQAIANCKRLTISNPNFSLNFNVSYHQIFDDGFLPFVQETLKKWELDSERMVVEITETNYNENPKALYAFIESCKAIGMRVAIDDFGTGYSSIELLLKYPSDIIKIDRILMKEMVDSKDSSDLIAGIVHSCHKFGKKVCVEGVETEKELEAVIAAQCDTIQGYYFHKPMEVSDFYRLLAETQSK